MQVGAARSARALGTTIEGIAHPLEGAISLLYTWGMDTPVPAPPLDQENEGDRAVQPLRPRNPEVAARVEAWWNGMLPEERALIEEANRLDRLDYDNNR